MLSFGLLLLLAFADVGLCDDCPRGWSYHEGLCYGISNAKVTWANAQTICSMQGAIMAEAFSQTGNDFLVDLVRNESSICIWLSAHDIFHEGMWDWISGSTEFYLYTNWAPDQPDNYRSGEDCLSLSRVKHLKWNDYPCSSTCNFVCVAPPQRLLGDQIDISRMNSP